MLLPLICAALLLFFPLYFIFSGDPGFLENEKKYASELPPFTADNVLSGAWGEDAEAWLADKMPLRGFWVGLNAYFAYATGRQNATDVYIDSRGDLLERPEGYDAAELGKRLGRIAEFAAASGGRTAVLAVPSAGYCAKPYLPGYVWSGFNDSELFGRISAAIAQPAAQAPAERAAAQQSLLPATAPAQLLHTLAVAPMQSAFAPAPALRSLAAAQAPARQGLLPSAALALAPAPAQPDAQAPAAAPARSAWQALSTAPVPSGSAGFIDILGEFAGTAEPMFYRTDHHWNMDGAYAAYRQVCRYFGFEPFERGRFSVSSVGGFYGSTYSTSGLWLAEPDTVELWQPPEQVSVTFSDKEGAYGSIFFESHLEALDKYPVFLDGNHPLTIVENLSPSAEARAAGTLLVVKDSYANSLVPLLIGHYSKIALIDLRYYRQSASETAAAQNASDILIVYSAKNLAGDADLLWLR
jgi:hypothetical protein